MFAVQLNHSPTARIFKIKAVKSMQSIVYLHFQAQIVSHVFASLVWIYSMFAVICVVFLL